ncbi:glycosyltransferase family 87 protein [Sandarakinorhabdus sp.]|uniref:glycosyltransferase family 87 protein n=1 Tax=Sandarakinorhabdus sp. TaxID=1916663 RepID=UPI00286DAB04|nr:glycosyltransferase family 87 protein [Sandarakinorhabdus sp.]
MLLVLCLAFAGQILLIALQLGVPALAPKGPPQLLDFQVFHIAGQLALAGDLGTAYDPVQFWAHTKALTGSPDRMLWPYPPHFNLVTAPLALLPLWLSYGVFTGGSLLFYGLALRRLSGGQHALVLAMLFPAIMICIRIGQNAFLVGGLMAWLASFALAEGTSGARTLAGVPLGLLTVKPQFLPGIGLYLLLRGEWRIIFAGGLVAALALALATLLLGSGVWLDFIHVMGELSKYLSRGLYQYYRMTSLYAALFTLTRDAGLALAGQIGLAGVLAMGLWLAARRAWPARHLMAAAVMASAVMTPYGYDYDLPVLGAAIALLAPDLAVWGRRAWPLLPLSWLACFAGLIIRAVFSEPQPALAVVPVLLLCAALLVLARTRPANVDPG